MVRYAWAADAFPASSEAQEGLLLKPTCDRTAVNERSHALVPAGRSRLTAIATCLVWKILVYRRSYASVPAGRPARTIPARVLSCACSGERVAIDAGGN